MLPAAAAASIFRREIRFEIMLMDEFLRYGRGGDERSRRW
jgi:hypothetical protein